MIAAYLGEGDEAMSNEAEAARERDAEPLLRLPASPPSTARHALEASTWRSMRARSSR